MSTSVVAKPKFERPTKFVSKEFIEELRNLPVPNNAISEFTFYRTYSRYIEELGRRETWLEAVVRAGEYSVELAIKQLKKAGKWSDDLMPIFVKEAEDLIRNMYQLKVFVSGRTLYTGGSKAAELYPLSNFNCSAAVIDQFKKIGEMFYLLMVGTGFGFRILKEDVAKLPAVRQDIEIIHKDYVSKPKWERLERTQLEMGGDTVVMEIGDSKEGWRESIDYFFDIHTKDEYKDIKRIIIVYDSIRPKGERLRTFGG
jgi:hypothetical protein